MAYQNVRREGALARMTGEPRTANPYAEFSKYHYHWRRGWDELGPEDFRDKDERWSPIQYIAEINQPGALTACRCGSCGFVAAFKDLNLIGDVSLTPGDPSPAGRCPECDSLSYIARDRVTELLEVNNRGIERRRKMRAMLIEAAEQFEMYAAHHHEKGTPESRQKALANEAMAFKCREAANV